MRLDVKYLRYMSIEEFRVLTAVEQGMKNHAIVPVELIVSIAGLRHGGVHKMISNLLRAKLVAHDRTKYDGYKLTYLGYDYLALRVFMLRGSISEVGSKIGVGKESDIYVVKNEEGRHMALKLHRLGRISFRNIKRKRDYMQHRKHASWLYMARLAAQKEYAFMQVLHARGFPVPEPIDANRHCVVMELMDAFPMTQVKTLGNPGPIYDVMMGLLLRLARHGLVHCDFNEFNLMINGDTRAVTVIDFPQMVSIDHANAKRYFERDVESIRSFFARQYRHFRDDFPTFSPELIQSLRVARLDEEAEASGFTSTMQGELEGFITLEELAKVDLEGDGIDVLSDDDDEDVETEAAADGEGGAADSAKAPPLPGTDSWVPLARAEGGVEEGGEKEEEEEEIDGVRQKYHRAKKVVGGLGDGFCGLAPRMDDSQAATEKAAEAVVPSTNPAHFLLPPPTEPSDRRGWRKKTKKKPTAVKKKKRVVMKGSDKIRERVKADLAKRKAGTKKFNRNLNKNREKRALQTEVRESKGAISWT